VIICRGECAEEPIACAGGGQDNRSHGEDQSYDRADEEDPIGPVAAEMKGHGALFRRSKGSKCRRRAAAVTQLSAFFADEDRQP
jgi:hypothetical protein